MPRVLISYAWEDDEHNAWVKKLAGSLMQAGAEVLFDEENFSGGGNLPLAMESAVADSDHIVIVCTPTYKERGDETPEGGVGYECNIMRGEMMNSPRPGKFIPILRKGDFDTSVPRFLRHLLWLDFRAADSTAAYEKLLGCLNVDGPAPTPDPPSLSLPISAWAVMTTFVLLWVYPFAAQMSPDDLLASSLVGIAALVLSGPLVWVLGRTKFPVLLTARWRALVPVGVVWIAVATMPALLYTRVENATPSEIGEIEVGNAVVMLGGGPPEALTQELQHDACFEVRGTEEAMRSWQGVREVVIECLPQRWEELERHVGQELEPLPRSPDSCCPPANLEREIDGALLMGAGWKGAGQATATLRSAWSPQGMWSTEQGLRNAPQLTVRRQEDGLGELHLLARGDGEQGLVELDIRSQAGEAVGPFFAPEGAALAISMADGSSLGRLECPLARGSELQLFPLGEQLRSSDGLELRSAEAESSAWYSSWKPEGAQRPWVCLPSEEEGELAVSWGEEPATLSVSARSLEMESGQGPPPCRMVYLSMYDFRHELQGCEGTSGCRPPTDSERENLPSVHSGLSASCVMLCPYTLAGGGCP